MRYHFAVLAAAFLTSVLPSTITAQEEPIQSGPRAVGESVVYRLDLETAGVKEGGTAQTTLTLTRVTQGLHVASTSPAAEGSALGDGAITGLDGPLRIVVEPYNQLQAALGGRDGHGRSTVNILAGGQEVAVPVTFTSSEGNGMTVLAFAGETNTRVKGIGAHVTVAMKATVVRGRLETASAHNDFDASIPFRKIHVDQVWSLTRLR
jgi:hypothetical protein